MARLSGAAKSVCALLLIDSFVMAVADTAPQEQQVQSETEQLDAWFDAKFEEQLQMSPVHLTVIGRKDQYEKIDDYSLEAMKKSVDWYRASVTELSSKFDYAKLTDQAKTSFDLWRYDARRMEEDWKWRNYGYSFRQIFGVQSFFPAFLINHHRVDTLSDAAAYISRLRESARAIDQLRTRAQASAGMGIRPPAFAYRAAKDQAQRVVTGAPFTSGADSDLWADIKKKIGSLEDKGEIDSERAKELRSQAQTALTESFEPSYQRLIRWLDQDVAHVQEAQGVSALPDGNRYYEYALAGATTTDLTADQIHALGLTEVARLRQQMIRAKDDFGFKGSLGEFFAFMREQTDDERFYFPDTDAGRQAYLDRSAEAIENIRAQLPSYFGRLPKAGLIVKRAEPFREEAGGSQFYESGPPDGSRPGTYYVHLSEMTALPKTDLEVTAYHEGIPGHHLQTSIAQELLGIPKFRTQAFFYPYVEGWALYAESVAKEMSGTYRDTLSEFGRLNMQTLRACRLVIDTGLHAQGWTKEQAIEYLQENTNYPEAAAVSQVERYLVLPGQATSYAIGKIKILELRKKAEAELGDRFDIRGFHDVVLGGGPLPLTLLERQVDEWISHIKDGA